MKKIKKIIIIIIIIIVILLGILFFINKNAIINTSFTDNIEPGNETFKPSYNISEIKSISSFETIDNCVNKFLNYVKENNSNAVYSILINNFIDDNKITKSNVLNNVIKINYECEYMTKKVYEYSADLSIKTYFVNGYILNKDNGTKQNCDFVINLDTKNNAFEIAQLEKTYTKYIVIDETNISIKNDTLKDEIKSITLNEFNSMKMVNGLRRKTNNGILF